ncbi:YadA-like family protein [Actinobacillus arthritidis]|nr:YadA-like family protein [Actinobacillus arthritidis]
MAKALTDLTNATFTSGTGNTVIDGNGITINPTGGTSVSLTNTGLNNGDNKITNVATGTNNTDAVNVSQLNDVKNIANAGWNIAANGTNATNVAPKGNVSLNNTDGNILITKETTDNNVTFALNKDLTLGKVGKDGVDGEDGSLGVNGKDGSSVVLNGKDGSIGLTGPKGADGTPGVSTNIRAEKGEPGVNGQPGETKTRIVYDTPDGEEQVATLNDGLKFVGDKGQVIKKKLNETLAIKGKLADTAAVTDKNLRVDNDGDELIIKMAKALTDLTNATFTSGTGNTVIDGNGITINPTGGTSVSLTNTGLNNGDNKITNVATGTNNTDAVNVSQLNDVKNIANAGWNIAANGTNATNVAPKGNVSLNNTDGNILITKETTDNNVTFALNKDLTLGKVGKDGVDGEDGSLGVNGKDGSSVVLNGKDGSIGLTGPKGADGTPGVSTNIRAEKGEPGVNGQPGETKTRIVYDTPDGEEQVATLNDGLKFVGDKGQVIKKKLNETLAIKGKLADTAAVTDKNLRVDNDGDELIIKMAKALTDLTNATFTSGTGNTVIDGNGITINPTGGTSVSLTNTGLNNGDNKITNVATGTNNTDAVNVSQLNDVKNIANAGWNIAANGTNATNVAPKGNVSLNNTDGNILITKETTDNNVTFALNKDLTLGKVGKDGVDGEDGSLGVNGKDGSSVVLNGKDGSIGLTGPKGADGKTPTTNIRVKNGEPGVNGQPGESKTRIVYDTPDGEEQVATLNDGLKFVGDKGQVIKKKLNETLAIKGKLADTAAVTDKNLRVDNDGDELIIKMAKALTDLTNATFTSGTGNTVIDGNGITINPTGGTSVSLTNTGLNNGGNKITNVATGTDDTDAVNVSQLNAVNSTANAGWNIQTNGNTSTNVKPGNTVNFANGDNIVINNNGTNVTVGLSKDIDLSKDGSIKAGDTVMNNDGVKVGDEVSLTKDGLTVGDVNISVQTGINAGDKQITNVKSGLDGTKLSDAKGDTLKNAANIGDLQIAVSSVTDASQGGGFGLADDNGNTVTENLGKTIQVKGDGNVKTTVTGKSLTVGLNKDVDLGKDGSLTTGGTKVSDKGVSFTDSLVNLTSNGLDNGGNKVINVKAGDVSETSTDAVNGSQLHATNQNVTNLQNTVAKGWNIEADKVYGSTGEVIGKSKANVAMGDTVAVKAGNNIEITQDGKNIAIATSVNPNFDSVKIGKGSNTAIISTTEDGAIKVANANGGPTRITNVAAGKKDNDAVNVAQLKGAVSSISHNINKVDKDLRAGIAGAMVAGNLYHVTIPGKSMISAGIGTYKNQGAVAVGYSRLSDNGKIGVKFSVNTNTRGDSGAASVGYQW